jgi:hypothetical protein
MKEQNRKHQRNRPLATKIKRLLVPAKGKDMHEHYPEEYFKRYWFNHQDYDGIAVIAQLEGMTQKATVHWMADVFYKFYIQHYVDEEVRLQKSAGEFQERVRRNLALKRICRQRGWSIDKLLKLESPYNQKPT